ELCAEYVEPQSARREAGQLIRRLLNRRLTVRVGPQDTLDIFPGAADIVWPREESELARGVAGRLPRRLPVARSDVLVVAESIGRIHRVDEVLLSRPGMSDLDDPDTLLALQTKGETGAEAPNKRRA